MLRFWLATIEDLFNLMLRFWLATIEDLPVASAMSLPLHRCTCSSVYLFSLFLPFRHNMQYYLSTHLSAHLLWYKVIGIEFCWVPSHCGLYWNEISDKLAKQGAMKNMSEISSNNLLLSSHHINSLLKKTVYKQIVKSKSAIPSCSRYLASVIYKLHLNSWNTKYSQNVT